MLELQRFDYVEIHVANASGTDNLTLHGGLVTLRGLGFGFG